MIKRAAMFWMAALTIAAAPALIAGIDEWTSLGPDGGHVTVLVVDPQNTRTIYAGAEWNGIFKSVDGGATWNAASAGIETGFVVTLAIDPGDTSTLYAAVASGGVFKTVDGGQNWSPARAGLPVYSYSRSDSYVDINALAIDPANPAIVFAGTGSGVFKTIDRGANWKPVNAGLPPYTLVTSLALDPSDPLTVYVGGLVTVFNLPTESTMTAIFKSTDGGANWTALSSPFRSSYFEIPFLLIDPRDSRTIYVGLPADGVFKSADGGATWNDANAGLPADYRRTYGLLLDPRDPDTLYGLMIYSGRLDDPLGGYANHPGRIFRSRDSAKSWIEVGSGLPGPSFDPVDYCSCVLTKAALAVDPAVSGTLYVGTDSEGVFKSVDSGATWTLSNSGLRAQPIRSLTIDRTSGAVYAAGDVRIFKTTDNGKTWTAGPWGTPDINIWTMAIDLWDSDTVYMSSYGLEDWPPGLFKSIDGGMTWRRLHMDGGFAFTLAFHPSVPGIIYAASGGFYKTVDGGETWTLKWPLAAQYIPSVSTIVIDPVVPGTMYLGLEWNSAPHNLILPLIYKSTDGGETWNPASDGLLACCVFALALDPQHRDTLYAGSGGGVYKSIDGGANWQVFSSGLPDDGVVTQLVIDPKDSQKIYAVNNHAVFRTVDAGATWTSLGRSLRAVNSLALDPFDSNTLSAATSSGIYSITLNQRFNRGR